MKRKIVLLNSCNGLYGGVESFLLNVFRYLDKDQFDVTFLTCGSSTYNMYRREIESTGGRVDTIFVYPSNFTLQRKAYYELKKYFNKEKPDVVHINSSALSFQLLASYAAKSERVDSVILHSHNFVRNENWIKRMLKYLLKIKLRDTGTKFLACSEGAAYWMFDSGTVKNRVEIIPNGINTMEFLYSEKNRNAFRKSLNISEREIIIGHIGRFQKQKNHYFIIDIFEKIITASSSYKLLLVGEGELKEEIEQYAKEKNVFNHIMFLGERKDIGDFLSAIDIFIFPSLFEGFGIAALEAQASGAKVFVSNTLPEDVNVTGEVNYLPIDDARLWADCILKSKLNHQREDYGSQIAKSKYDKQRSGLRMQQLYSED